MRKTVLIAILLISACYNAYSQKRDTSGYLPASLGDTTFLHKVVPTGYISGNLGVALPLNGFYTFTGQNKVLEQTGGIDNVGLAVPFKGKSFGLSFLIGSGYNKPDAEGYTRAFMAQNGGFGNGAISKAHISYYTGLYYMGGMFHTITLKRFAVDMRLMGGWYSWYSPDGTFTYTPVGGADSNNLQITGTHVVSPLVDGGVDLRFEFYDRFDFIINADAVYGYIKRTRFFEATFSGGIAYEIIK